jgi:hypothetical protein
MEMERLGDTDARIVYQDVDAAKVAQGRLRELDRRLLFSHVAAHDLEPVRMKPLSLAQVFVKIAVAIHGYNARNTTSQIRARNRESDAGVCAGDNCDFSC